MSRLKGFDKVWLYNHPHWREKTKTKKKRLNRIPVVVTAGDKTDKKSSRRKQLLTYSRRMQNVPTKHEQILFSALRKRYPKLNIVKQAVYHFNDDTAYIVDIYIAKRKIAIEVDGSSHNTISQKGYDLIRDERLLKTFGLNIYRFKNHDIETQLEAVLQKIRDILNPKIAEHLKPTKKYKKHSQFKMPESVPYINRKLLCKPIGV